MDAAARLPDAQAAPGEPIAGLAGAERVRQAREREQRHAASDPAPNAQAAVPGPAARPEPPARSTPAANDGHSGAETDRATLGADGDDPAPEAAADAWSTEASGKEQHRQGIDSAAAPGDPGDARHDATGSGAAAEPPTPARAAGEPPTQPGTADAGSESRPTMQPADAGARHGPPPRRSRPRPAGRGRLRR